MIMTAQVLYFCMLTRSVFPFQLKILIAKITRVLEVCGYSISILVLFFAIVAFCYFR